MKKLIFLIFLFFTNLSYAEDLIKIGENIFYNKEFTYILFANHSISILPEESIRVHKASKENTSFELFFLKD